MESSNPFHPIRGFALLFVVSRGGLKLFGARSRMAIYPGAERVGTLKGCFDAAKELVVVSNDEQASGEAMLTLKAAGFTKVKYLKGGLKGWNENTLLSVGRGATAPWLAAAGLSFA
jgi:rhodanese-related sulfurtransferase